MKNNRLPILLTLTLLLTTTKTLALDYSDLEETGMTCPGRDSCANMAARSPFSDRNCECDAKCVSYGDCCIDVPQPRNPRRLTHMTCMEYGLPISAIYARGECPGTYTGPQEVRSKCQARPRDLSDPLQSAPVTDTSNSVTYFNEYCALCSDASVANLKTWDITLNCNFNGSNPDEDEVTRNMRYDAARNRWVVDRDGRENACVVLYHKPADLTEGVRFCKPRMVSSCPSSYRNRNTIRACAAYTAAVYGARDVLYKNPHCAICNNVKVSKQRCCCVDPGNILSKGRKPFSFRMLLDVNSSSDTSRCSADQKWDPYFKKCRTLHCALSGYRVVNGKCVGPAK